MSISETTQDDKMTACFAEAKVIALVGASPKDVRPSYQVMDYLLTQGFTVIPVNPGMAGQEILGQHCYAQLADIPHNIDIVDVFRQSEACLPLADEAIAVNAKCFWMQIGVINEAARQLAETAGLTVVVDKCTKIEHERLFAKRA